MFATLNHSQKSRSGDIEILRTIGATKAELKFSLIIQYLFIGLIAFVLSMILLIVLRSTTKGEFRLALEYLDFLDYIIVLVLVLAMSYLLSLLFIKGIFKKTVRKGLTDERRGQ